MTGRPEWIEACYARQAVLLASIERALDEHLPPAREGQISNKEEALMLLVSNSGPVGRYLVAKKSSELEALARFEEAIESLAAAWDALTPNTRGALTHATLKLDPNSVRRYYNPQGLPSMAIVAALPDLMRASRKAAMRSIDSCEEAGEVGWQAVSLFGNCRELWKTRTGRDAPRTFNETGPFYRFVSAVLEVFGAGKPIPAMRCWNRLHREGKIRA